MTEKDKVPNLEIASGRIADAIRGLLHEGLITNRQDVYVVVMGTLFQFDKTNKYTFEETLEMVKVSLNAYLEMLTTKTETETKTALKQRLREVRRRAMTEEKGMAFLDIGDFSEYSLLDIINAIKEVEEEEELSGKEVH